MKIALYISMIALSAIALFVLPKMIEKKTYITCLSVILGVVVVIPNIALPIVKKYVKPYHERQVTTIVETPPIDDELYNSVREIMVQKNMGVHDLLIDYAINSLGKGEHTALEIADRIDEIRTGKVTVGEVAVEHNQQNTSNTKDLILIAIISLIVVVFIGFVTQVSHVMLDMVINFHITHNAENIHRQPVKFFIENQNAIKLAFSYIFFFGSFIMFYGVIFKMKS